MQVAADRGAAGITHRAVTDQAGVPLATVSYFFDSINQLVEEALRVFGTEERDRLTGLADLLAAEQRTPDEIVTAFAAVSQPRLPETLAMFEAYLHAARGPELRESVAEALEASRRAAVAGARAAGAPDPEAMAPALVALAHGFALHQLAAPAKVDPDALRAALRAQFIGHLVETGHADLALRLAAS